MEGLRTPKTAATPRRVFIVDDYPLVRKGMSQLINQEDDLRVCGEAVNAAEALERIREVRPDALVVDISLPGTNGLDLIRTVKEEFPGLPIVIYSMYEEHLYADRAIRAGAMGYVMKHESTGKLIDALRRVLAGDIYLSEKMTTQVLNQAVVRQQGDEIGPAAVKTLSDRELEVFRLIGEGLGTRQIAEKLNLSVKTIETHREHIKEKLQLDSGAALVHYAVRCHMQNSS